jgi:glycosyltransferase involved in cell wall biosynthesis
VVIPAHDEASRIGRCLRSLGPLQDIEVVVVCNGCTDDTAAVARSHGHGVRVVELPEASKTSALNAGDRMVDGFPRIYVDADVAFSEGGLPSLIAALGGGVLAAAPAADVDTAGCSWLVRSYYENWCRLGVVVSGVCGSGVYALSEAGRERFGEFPDLVADDLFVDQRFSNAERAIVQPGVSYRAPATARALVARKTRVFAGNLQLRRYGLPRHPLRRPTGGWLIVIARRPRLVLRAPAFVAITVLAKVRARRLLRRGRSVWADR